MVLTYEWWLPLNEFLYCIFQRWIGNYRRKVEGKPTKSIKLKTCIRTKLHYTSYNEFCKDKTMGEYLVFLLVNHFCLFGVV